jgi:hypothetical protein
MTQYARWNDPKSGGTYATRERLTSAQMNDYLAALREFDAAFTQSAWMNWTSITDANTPLGAVLAPGGGNIYLINNKNPSDADGYTRAGLIANDQVGGAAATQLASYVSGATSGTVSLIATGSKSYTVAADGTVGTGVSFASIVVISATSGELIWCDGSSKFVAIGANGGNTATYIETSADGTAWALRSTATTDLGGGGGYLATDGTNVLAVGTSANTKVMYSTDGGVTWAAHAHGRGSISCVGCAYDSVRGLWLITDNTNDKLWSATNPTSGTWTEESAFTSGATRQVVAIDYTWAAVFQGAGGYESVHVSRDAGANWVDLGIYAERLFVVDGRLGAYQGSTIMPFSNPITPLSGF